MLANHARCVNCSGVGLTRARRVIQVIQAPTTAERSVFKPMSMTGMGQTKLNLSAMHIVLLEVLHQITRMPQDWQGSCLRRLHSWVFWLIATCDNCDMAGCEDGCAAAFEVCRRCKSKRGEIWLRDSFDRFDTTWYHTLPFFYGSRTAQHFSYHVAFRLLRSFFQNSLGSHNQAAAILVRPSEQPTTLQKL